ncbi:MAG: CBS domain-containing protein [Bacillota bacterium]|nr:CBS domain-containing protein [Bacillota bacterium]
MTVKDLMTTNVASVCSDDTVDHAAQLMREYNVGSIPVCDNNNKIIGIITDRDIALRSSADGQNTKAQSVRDIMSSNPVVGRPDMDVNDAARIMSERQIRRLPIVENNNLIGVVSLGDIAVEPSLKNNAKEALSDISKPSTPEY